MSKPPSCSQVCYWANKKPCKLSNKSFVLKQFLLCFLEIHVFSDNKTPALLCQRSFWQQAVSMCGWPAPQYHLWVSLAFNPSRVLENGGALSPFTPLKNIMVSKEPPKVCSHLHSLLLESTLTPVCRGAQRENHTGPPWPVVFVFVHVCNFCCLYLCNLSLSSVFVCVE